MLDDVFLNLDELDLQIPQRRLVSIVAALLAARLHRFRHCLQTIFLPGAAAYLNISGHSRQHLFHTMM